jgi:hypothetical protein
MLFSLPRIVVFGLVLQWASGAFGCSVPVFRYALERWAADPFQVQIFYQESLEQSDVALIERLENADANISISTVDVGAITDANILETWKEQETETLPWLYVSYPDSHPLAVELASGALDPKLADSVVDSPMRKQIANQLVDGETAVWVLLESGDEAKDEAAWKTLEASLNELESVLELPTLEQEDIDAGLVSVSEDELKIAFAAQRLSRDDEAEKMFVRMLLDTEEDLIDSEEPMVFPIFGRGRVLYGLVGKGIIPETIEHAAAYLTGACSCQVKEDNPGVDLLMAMNWNEVVETSLQEDRELPELAGILPATPAEDEAAPKEPTETKASAPQAPAIKENDSRSILWATLGSLVFMLVVVGVGSALFSNKDA